jgi:hypothetical protein
MRDQQVNCDDCEYKATSTYDLENHVKLKHNVKQFFFSFSSYLGNYVTLIWNILGN